MSFYDRFEFLCQEKGATPTQAARENGIAQSVVAMWKKRGSTPKAETVQKLADYFGVSVDYLIGINGLPINQNGRSQEEQETSAILSFLRDIGYVLLNIVEESAAAVILDRRSNLWYEIPIEVLDEAERSITTFAKFQINETLSKYTPRTHLRRSAEDILPRHRRQDAPEGAEEGE